MAGKELQLTLEAGRYSIAADITGDIVEHLGATLGPSLTHLTLSRCSVHHDFWPAVWRHLPGLQELSIADNVVGFGDPALMTFQPSAMTL
jgi:hypothetical protein